MRYLIAVFIAFFSLPSIAEDYYWLLEGSYQPANSSRHSSPAAACSSADYSSRLPTVTAFSSVTRSSDTRFRCFALSTFADGRPPSTSNHNSAQRYGTSCPSGKTYNSQTGECESPPPEPNKCEALAGKPTSWSLMRPNLNGLGAVEYVCSEGCRVSLGSSTCGATAEGATTGICWGLGNYTGAECQPGDNPSGGTPPKDPADPDGPPPTCGTGWSWSGTTCVKDPPKPCDPSTGEVCPPTDPTEPTDPTDPTDPESPGDGGGDGDGEGGDGDGDGTGSGDGEGDGDGTGNGEGEGGDGACDPAKDPNKCQPQGNKGTSSSKCETAPTHSGDPLLGAILTQQWHTMCAGDELKAAQLATGLQQEGLVNADTLNNVLGKDAESVDNEVQGIISGLYASGSGSSCPIRDATISTKWGPITLPWAMNCPIFNVIAAVILFFSYLAAGWILFNALARND